MKMYVPLKVESIVSFYDNVARQLGYSSESIDNLNYDCRKICVSSERAELIEQAYGDRESFGMSWVLAGPKAIDSLHDEEVEIEEGFIVKKGE